MLGLAAWTSLDHGGPVRWASRVKQREGRDGRERVLQVGWIEVDDHRFGFADGVADGQALALYLAEDHVRVLLLWQAAGAPSLRALALRAAKFALARPLSNYRRLRGFIRGFEVEARDPAYYDARYWTGVARARHDGNAWSTALCLKVLP